MKKELTTKITEKVFGAKENHKNINKVLKAAIVNFGDERGDIVVENDNFGTRRKYACFTNGKKMAGLHPMQIVFAGIDVERTLDGRFVDKEGNVRKYKEVF